MNRSRGYSDKLRAAKGSGIIQGKISINNFIIFKYIITDF
jgi:hypothetical protein